MPLLPQDVRIKLGEEGAPPQWVSLLTAFPIQPSAPCTTTAATASAPSVADAAGAAAAELLDVADGCGGLYAWITPTYYIAERGENAIKLIGGDFVQLRGQNPVRATFNGGAGKRKSFS